MFFVFAFHSGLEGEILLSEPNFGRDACIVFDLTLLRNNWGLGVGFSVIYILHAVITVGTLFLLRLSG